jgi:hypothetical protein
MRSAAFDRSSSLPRVAGEFKRGKLTASPVPACADRTSTPGAFCEHPAPSPRKPVCVSQSVRVAASCARAVMPKVISSMSVISTASRTPAA